MTTGLELPDWNKKRIYVVVALTIQHPLGLQLVDDRKTGEPKTLLYREPGHTSIVQPPGRAAAQAGHAYALARTKMFEKYVSKVLKYNKIALLTPTSFAELNKPITQIILGARDSFELRHVGSLLDSAFIPNHVFVDSDQVDYGNAQVQVATALSTEPVSKDEIAGILDYLPLWTPANGRRTSDQR